MQQKTGKRKKSGKSKISHLESLLMNPCCLLHISHWAPHKGPVKEASLSCSQPLAMLGPVLLPPWGERDPTGQGVDRHTDRWAPSGVQNMERSLGCFCIDPGPTGNQGWATSVRRRERRGTQLPWAKKKGLGNLRAWGICAALKEIGSEIPRTEKGMEQREREFCYEIVPFWYTSPSHHGSFHLRDWKGLRWPQQCVGPGIHQQLEFDPWGVWNQPGKGYRCEQIWVGNWATKQSEAAPRHTLGLGFKFYFKLRCAMLWS